MSSTGLEKLPKIAVIGRPNVGKSSFFNRMLKHRKAIVESAPGITRDRLFMRAKFEGVNFMLIDTGGITHSQKDNITQMVYQQSAQAIEESDAVIFICDVSTGITYQDEHIVSILRRSGKKVFLAVNKIDKTSFKDQLFDFYKFGLGQPYGISALQGDGMQHLCHDIAEYLKKEKPNAAFELPAKGIKVAIAGRPNVGKSSFINTLLNEERLIVDSAPGTTRDSVEVSIMRDKKEIILVDTAGVKHKKKMKETVEIFSLARTKKAIKNSDAAIIMIDGNEGLFRDDIAVIDYVIKEGKPCILIVNKWDLVKDIELQAYKDGLVRKVKALRWVPVIFCSVKERHNIIKAIDIVKQSVENSKISIPTSKLNSILEKIQHTNPHPAKARVRPKIFYATQIENAPPKFLLFCSYPRLINPSYLRFIENKLRQEFGLIGVPVSLELREKR